MAGLPLVPFSEPLFPSFETHHLSHVHELKWKIVVECRGKNRDFTGSAPVTVVGPSEDQEFLRSARLGQEEIIKAYKEWAEGSVLAPALSVTHVDLASQGPPRTGTNSTLPPPAYTSKSVK
ncbi:uncharacterized protein BCR38DRAFT_485483 [Pseudomassariella vexata]|uniref:Uncharacterized protein n=1 Tax=Pseudomassariella vexata TaxID=1141098 RepID=A0A1Y2DZ08_9PEZI|nr:uncharacterized protein BCR38DRAFT_485483 [Pseudomassariella vexata]ORY64324.1 hypothetical protein BCR38DRAFT_485483 [Pseudomassariella vexata]